MPLPYAITQSNAGIDRLLATTTNPRHRDILPNYARHRFLEFSGRYDEVLADDLIVDTPVYNLHALGFNTVISGKDHVRSHYKYWAKTTSASSTASRSRSPWPTTSLPPASSRINRSGAAPSSRRRFSAFFTKRSPSTSSLKLLAFHGLKAEPNSMYLYSAFEETIWPYDDRCRLMREDVLEFDAASVKIRKLDPSEVMTTAQAPLIKPLPDFDDYVLCKSAAA